MDFVSGFPWKLAHFLGMKTMDTSETLSQLYIRDIIRLHGVLLSIVSNRDSWFEARFWQSLQQAMGIELHFSTAFHP